jgi:hypothetical protein
MNILNKFLGDTPLVQNAAALRRTSELKEDTSKNHRLTVVQYSIEQTKQLLTLIDGSMGITLYQAHALFLERIMVCYRGYAPHVRQ